MQRRPLARQHPHPPRCERLKLALPELNTPFARQLARVSVTLGPVNTVRLPWRALRAAAACTAAAVGTYLSWLGWDKPVGPSDFGTPHTYSLWQVIGVAVTLLAIAAVATWLGHGSMALLVVPVVFTSAAAIDGIADDWLWQFNALLTALGSSLVVFYAYVCTRMAQRRLAHQHAQVT